MMFPSQFSRNFIQWFYQDSNEVTTTKFCTWHDSSAVVAHAKICSDIIIMNGIAVKEKFPSNFNCDRKSVSEMGSRSKCPPVLQSIFSGAFSWFFSCILMEFLVKFGPDRSIENKSSLVQLTHCGLVTLYMATDIQVNIGSSNGLLLDSTKPSLEPILTYHQ